MIPGFDISKWEVIKDFMPIKEAGYAFGSTRATVGDYYTDPTFIGLYQGDQPGPYGNYWPEMKEAGFLRTAYHVFTPDRPVVAQMDRFFLAVGDDLGELPLCLDAELARGCTKQQITDKIHQCLKIMYDRSGRKPIIYTRKYWWNDYVIPDIDFLAYPLWVANYTTTTTPLLPNPWTTWTIWQYTEAGKLPGYTGGVDLNYFNGTLKQLYDLADVEAPKSWEQSITEWARNAFEVCSSYNGPDPD